MNFSPSYNIIIVISLCLIFQSCEKVDIPVEIECPEDVDIGTFHMLETSHNFIPYSNTIKKIVLSDSMGNEVIGQIELDTLQLAITTLHNEYFCEQDSTQTFDYKLKREFRVIRLTFEDIDVSLLFNLYVSVQRGDEIYAEPSDSLFFADFFNIHLRTPIDTSQLSISRIGLTVNPRNHPHKEYSIPNSDIYNIHGVDFFNVYHQSTVTPEGEFRILYNVEKGLIGLENHDKSISLKYEYIE